jgi:hypothetical protein
MDFKVFLESERRSEDVKEEFKRQLSLFVQQTFESGISDVNKWIQLLDDRRRQETTILARRIKN